MDTDWKGRGGEGVWTLSLFFLKVLLLAAARRGDGGRMSAGGQKEDEERRMCADGRRSAGMALEAPGDVAGGSLHQVRGIDRHGCALCQLWHQCLSQYVWAGVVGWGCALVPLQQLHPASKQEDQQTRFPRQQGRGAMRQRVMR